MLGIQLPDIILLLVYLLGITALGLWTRKKIQSSGDYFMGGRRFGKALMIAQAFGTGTHTDQPVSVAGASYSIGLAGIWYQWLWLFVTPFYWLIAPIYRRLRYVTMADFFRERYGAPLAVLYTLMGMIFFCMQIGVMLKGTGVTIEGLTGGALPETPTIFLATALFVVYGLAGGLIAAVFTDAIQGVLILVLSFMIIPFAINQAGGIEAIHAGLPEHMFSLIAPHEVTVFFIIMVVINGLVGVVVQPHHMAIGGSGKTEIACRTGWTYGNFLKRFATMGWTFTGVFAAFLFPGLIFEQRELAFGIAARNLLPVGFVGLMLAAMLAAVMSTCDAFMVHASALFTRNIYVPYVRPNAPDKTQLLVARVSSIFIVGGGVFFAFAFPSVVSGIMEIWKMTAFLGIAFWFGIIWKRANRWGALASAGVMAGLSVYTGSVLGWSLPEQIALYLPAGIAVMILASKLTPQEPAEKLHSFYTLLDTPVGEEHRLQEANVNIMLAGELDDQARSIGAKSPMEHFLDSRGSSRLLLVDLLHLSERFSWKTYRVDLIGFLAGIGIVGLIILIMLFLANWGSVAALQ